MIRGLDEGLIDEFASRPSFADDVVFEIFIERRFLLGYKSIRRTKSVTLDRVPTVDGDREGSILRYRFHSAIDTRPRLQVVRCHCTMGSTPQQNLKIGSRLEQSRSRSVETSGDSSKVEASSTKHS